MQLFKNLWRSILNRKPARFKEKRSEKLFDFGGLTFEEYEQSHNTAAELVRRNQSLGEARLYDVWNTPKPNIPDIAVILDGGLVQNVVSRDGSPVRVTIVDYDVEGAGEDELTAIPQDSGETADAYLSEGGFVHDTSADEPFWQAVVGDALTKPTERSVFISIINGYFTPRVRCFRTAEERRADLMAHYNEAFGDDIQGGGWSQEMLVDCFKEKLGLHVTLIRTAMNEV